MNIISRHFQITKIYHLEIQDCISNACYTSANEIHLLSKRNFFYYSFYIKFPEYINYYQDIQDKLYFELMYETN